MRGLFGVVFISVIVFGVFASFDAPLYGARRIVGLEDPQAKGRRQAVMGLRIAIDLEARRKGRRVAVLLEDWLYCYPETGDVFRVPRGYETDFATIPSLARAVVNPFGNHAETAVIHDWLYAVGEQDKRLEADQIFRFAMKEQGVNIVRRNVMYSAVRAGGGEAYGRDDEWDDRFRDPITLSDAPPPIDKPDLAAVENIGNCDKFGPQLPSLL